MAVVTGPAAAVTHGKQRFLCTLFLNSELSLLPVSIIVGGLQTVIASEFIDQVADQRRGGW